MNTGLTFVEDINLFIQEIGLAANAISLISIMVFVVVVVF